MKIIYWISFLAIGLCSCKKANIQSNKISCIATYSIDTHSLYRINNFRNLSVQPLPSNKNIAVGYNLNSAVWCTMQFKNHSSMDTSVCLSFPNIHLDSIQLYNHNEYQLIGDRTTNVSPYLHANAFEINLKGNETKEVVVRIKKIISFMDFSYEWHDTKDMESNSKRKMVETALFLGVIVLLILFNLLLYSISKQSIYILYVIHSILTLLYVMITSGFSRYLFMNDFLYFSEARIYTASIWYIGMSIFISQFLEVKKYQPKIFKSIMLLNIINTIMIGITLFLLMIKEYYFLRVFANLGYLIFLVNMFFVIRAAIYHLKINKNNSIYILASFLPHFIWSISIILKAYKITPNEINIDWLVYIALYEIVLFGYVLSRNYLTAFQQNNRLTKQIIEQKEKNIESIHSAQVRERRQIADIIHDSFGSKLAHILHLVDMQNHESVKTQIKELSYQIRELSHQIMPKSLEEGALISAIETEVNNWNTIQQKPSIRFYSYDFPEKMKEKWLLDIFLITLELMHNASKHASAQTMQIEFYTYPTEYVFQYTDDGIGFDANTAKGFGLTTITNRIENLKGTISIDSRMNEGTVVQISLPKLKQND
jgi:two-component system, sensor histidine kinase LadS